MLCSDLCMHSLHRRPERIFLSSWRKIALKGLCCRFTVDIHLCQAWSSAQMLWSNELC